MLYGVTAPKHVLTNCKSCKIEQHGLSLGLITLSDHPDVLNSLEWSNLEERRKRHLLVKMFKVSIIISYRGAVAWNQLSNQTREIGDLIFYFLLFQIITIFTSIISLAYYTN